MTAGLPRTAKAAGERGALIAEPAPLEGQGEAALPFSPAGEDIRAYLRQPATARKPVGYNRAFLESYRPNETFYLSTSERAHLAAVGKPDFEAQPAGTYAKQILKRLLIDLSWNSSRLEGNTYSLLDTRRLIEFGEEAEGRDRLEAQMILNHKDAIEFLVSTAEEIGFNRYTVLNLHAILANNLPADESAEGRLHRIAVGIEKSVFHRLEVPQLIEEAVIGVYEMNRVELLRDVFIWAYERSAARYAAVRQSLGEPDPFRLEHRETLRTIVSDIVRAGMGRKAAVAHIASWTQAHIAPPDRERFRELAENELLALHEGNFARNQIRPAEFQAWRKVWT